jgi:hypothetical protein
MKHLLIVLTSILLFTYVSFSQDKPAGKVHGYVFGDYFYVLGADQLASRGSGQYSSVKKDFQAFQFRRMYLYYDYTFNDDFSAQFLLEGNDKTDKIDGKYGLFVKTAYLEWKELIPMGSITLGLVPTPTWSLLSEKVWNYRSIEKTIIDFRGFGNASDFGVLFRGKFDEKGMFNYSAMIGNGSGQKPEMNKYKKYYLSLSVKPIKEFVMEGYIDYEPAADEKYKTTLKGFAAYQTESITGGIEIFQQFQNKAGINNVNIIPFGVSFFLWAPIPGTEKLNGFARFDIFNPDINVNDAGFNENFITFGFDYMPIKDIHFMPNLWINTYSNKEPNGSKRYPDVVGRLTFFYVYK